jgi:hypothetical protein
MSTIETIKKYEIYIILSLLFIYFVGYTVFLTSSSYDSNSISPIEWIFGIMGFLTCMWLSAYLKRTIFEDNEETKNIFQIGLYGSITTILMVALIVANVYNVKGLNDPNWTRYNLIIFPLLGGLVLISEEATIHFFNYMFKIKHYNVALSITDSRRSTNSSPLSSPMSSTASSTVSSSEINPGSMNQDLTMFDFYNPNKGE